MWLCFQTYLRDSVCFAGMSFLLQNMDGTEGRSWDILIQKRKNTGGNRTAASSEGTAGFFTENVVP